MGSMDSDAFYFCLKHETVEKGAGCKALDRMGPYPTAAAAAGWKSQVEERNAAWKEEDERWDDEND